jgi:hypothetical protein
MKISDLRCWKLSKTSQSHLEELFYKKRESFKKQQDWYDYLTRLESVEHIKKFSNYASPTDYLIETINSSLPFDKFIIRVEGHDQFIIIEKDFAEKVLVLGALP